MPVRKSRKRRSRSPCKYGRKKSLRRGCKKRSGPKRKSIRRSRKRSPRRSRKRRSTRRRSRKRSPRRSRKRSPRRSRKRRSTRRKSRRRSRRRSRVRYNYKMKGKYVPPHRRSLPPGLPLPPSIIEYRTRNSNEPIYHNLQSANSIELSNYPNIQLTRHIYSLFLRRIREQDINNLYVIAPRYYWPTKYGTVKEDIQFLVTGTRDHNDENIKETARREGFEETGLHINDLEPFYEETNYNHRHKHDVTSTYYMSDNFNSNITGYGCKHSNDDKTQKIGLVLYGTRDHVLSHLNELFRRFKKFPQEDNPWRCLQNDNIQSVCAIKLSYLLSRLQFRGFGMNYSMDGDQSQTSKGIEYDLSIFYDAHKRQLEKEKEEEDSFLLLDQELEKEKEKVSQGIGARGHIKKIDAEKDALKIFAEQLADLSDKQNEDMIMKQKVDIKMKLAGLSASPHKSKGKKRNIETQPLWNPIPKGSQGRRTFHSQIEARPLLKFITSMADKINDANLDHLPSSEKDTIKKYADIITTTLKTHTCYICGGPIFANFDSTRKDDSKLWQAEHILEQQTALLTRTIPGGSRQSLRSGKYVIQSKLNKLLANQITENVRAEWADVLKYMLIILPAHTCCNQIKGSNQWVDVTDPSNPRENIDEIHDTLSKIWKEVEKSETLRASYCKSKFDFNFVRFMKNNFKSQQDFLTKRTESILQNQIIPLLSELQIYYKNIDDLGLTMLSDITHYEKEDREGAEKSWAKKSRRSS